MTKLATFIALALVSKLACANFITNGGFDSALTGNSTPTQPYACTGFSTVEFQEGTRSVYATGCNPGATFKQTISGLTIGDTYTLAYWLKNTVGNNVGLPAFTTTLGGTLLENLAPTASFNWTQYSHDWTATAATADLLFSAKHTSNGNSWYLDNVALNLVQPVAISEPGALMLLGVGAMMFGFAIRERARSM